MALSNSLTGGLTVDGKHPECAFTSGISRMLEEHGPFWPMKLLFGMFVLSLLLSSALVMCGVQP
jgi:hypothetical protein